MHPDLSIPQDVLQILIIVFGFGTMILQEYLTYKGEESGYKETDPT